jgi:hypothetical protein
LLLVRRQNLIRDPELAGRPKSAALMKLGKKGRQVGV